MSKLVVKKKKVKFIELATENMGMPPIAPSVVPSWIGLEGKPLISKWDLKPVVSKKKKKVKKKKEEIPIGHMYQEYADGVYSAITKGDDFHRYRQIMNKEPAICRVVELLHKKIISTIKEIIEDETSLTRLIDILYEASNNKFSTPECTGRLVQITISLLLKSMPETITGNDYILRSRCAATIANFIRAYVSFILSNY